jgi:hypothetical protein
VVKKGKTKNCNLSGIMADQINIESVIQLLNSADTSSCLADISSDASSDTSSDKDSRRGRSASQRVKDVFTKF